MGQAVCIDCDEVRRLAKSVWHSAPVSSISMTADRLRGPSFHTSNDFVGGFEKRLAEGSAKALRGVALSPSRPRERRRVSAIRLSEFGT